MVSQSGSSNGWMWWKLANGMKVCFRLHSFSVNTTPLQGGFYYGRLFDYLDLPFSFSSKGVFVTNANVGNQQAFSMAYETGDNRSASRVGGVNVIRWDSARIDGTAAILVVGW